MTDHGQTRPTDNAFLGDIKGGSHEPTYGGALSFMRRRYTRALQDADAVVWGIPFDAATSNRPGCRFGPQAIRRASAIFDGDPQFPFGADPFRTLAAIDFGDCGFDYGRPGEIPSAIAAQARTILSTGTWLLSLGGDHFVTYPLLQAHAERHGPLALIQFDAHQDTWPDQGDRIDHGTFVGRAVREELIEAEHSIQIGIRTVAPEDCGIEVVSPDDLDKQGMSAVLNRIKQRVGDRPAYCTFDIDCLDPAFAPGTGTPVAGGLSSREALALLRGFDAAGVNLVGGDVVEVSPPYDHADITAIAGATVAMVYLCLLAERRRR
ncbi:MAG: agmatinase [Hyphomicrobiales bacterium]|nr:agmatinase [Hyphomicrobiales bacterium]